MKTKKSLVTLFAMVMVFLASAVEKPKMSVQTLNADQVIVAVVNNNTSIFELSILAKNGDLVYYKQTEKPVSSYQKVFDMADLENGDYKLKLRINGTNLERGFQVTSRRIYFDDPEMDFDPYFNFDGESIRFSYLNNKKEKFKMKIYKGTDLVYQTTLGKGSPINSGYDLSKLETGNYELTLSSFNKEFSYQFEK